MSIIRIRTTLATATLSMILLMIATAVIAGSDGPEGTFDLSWNTIDGGGATFSTGGGPGGFSLGGTIGQPDAGPTMTGGGPGGFELTGGFWPGAGTAPEIDTCPADIAPQPNGDGLINVDDLVLLINSWGPCVGCPADFVPEGGNGTVNVDDLVALINAWGLCP